MLLIGPWPWGLTILVYGDIAGIRCVKGRYEAFLEVFLLICGIRILIGSWTRFLLFFPWHIKYALDLTLMHL